MFVGEISDLIFVSIYYSYPQGNYIMDIEIICSVGSSLSFESVNLTVTLCICGPVEVHSAVRCWIRDIL